ncbi:hypothetical protein [Roseateles microcysteis]|uniref:hypothetical protein n=1 Tax=Roseateles microcysteis TaxID=3119057 RepID=UPI002FE57686
MPHQLSVPTRINNPSKEELADAGARLEGGEGLVVQFDRAIYTSNDLKTIDELSARYGSQLEVRFYGHYNSDFDAKALLEVPSVANLSIDCLQSVLNVETLATLTHLERLSIGVHNLAAPTLLKNPNLQTVRSLSLGPTKSNNLDLSYLSGYGQLESLYLSGHTRGIDAISDLAMLKSLALWCIPKRTQFDFIGGVTNLSRLTIGLGGRDSISEVAAPKLQELEIVRVRGLSKLEGLDRFPELTALTVEDQIQLKHLDITPANSRLKHLKLFNCKTLQSVSGLEHLIELNEIRLGLTAVDPAHFLSTSFSSNLKICAFYTGKSREDRRIREALDARGYLEFRNGT